MDVSYCNVRYITKSFDDQEAGCGGGILFVVSSGVERQVGKIVFWDSVGQFFIELGGEEIPLEIVEEFISEVKEKNPIE